MSKTSSKAFKLCYNNVIHKIAKAPESYEALVDAFHKTFKSNIPTNWVLQYDDEEGDRIMLANENDFQVLLELEAENTSRTTKIYIVSLDEMNKSISIVPSAATLNESYQIITEKVEEVKVEEKKLIQKKVYPYNVTLNRVVYTIPTRITTNVSTIYQTLSLTNSGTEEWPSGCIFTHLSGVEGPDVKGVSLVPGKEFSCVILLKNNGQVGDQTSTWTLAFYDGLGQLQHVGEPFTIVFTVVEPDSEFFEIDKCELKIESIVSKPIANETIDESKIIEKARYIKEMFPFVEYENLLEFIRGVPNITLQELADNYIK